MTQSMISELRPLQPNRYEALKPYYERYSSDIHDLNLTNLIMWRKKHNLHTLELGGYLWIVYKPADPFGTFFSEPIGNYDDLKGLAEATRLWVDYCKTNHLELKLRHIGTAYLRFLEASEYGIGINVMPVESDFDYVYLSEKLATLSGNAYHKKKNHLNQFQRHYANRSRIEPITTSNASTAFIAAREWCVSNGCGDSLDLCFEFQSIFEILSSWETQEKHGVEGVVIFVDNLPVALTFGECIVGDTFLVHVEKADQNVQGIYTAINQAMASQIHTRCKYINREQDLGIEGLRKAKQSYHPDHMIKKFDVTLIESL